MMGSRRVLVPLAEGFEEIEAVTVIDVLRRAGAEVCVAGVVEGPVRASRGVVVVPDTTLAAVAEEDFDLIVLPGGMPGARHLSEDARILRILERMKSEDRWIGAICAAPAVVLGAAGFLEGVNATCHPGFKEKLVRYDPSPVVTDGKIVTSQAPGTAMAFAIHLVEVLFGPEKAREVAGPMGFDPVPRRTS